MDRFKEEMLQALETVKNIEGDFAEFGVFKGGSFVKLAPIAKEQKKPLHAFDSFKGLAEPSKFDVSPTGITAYPKGKFNVGGPQSLINEMNSLGFVQDKDYFIWAGYVPEIFDKAPKDIKFSFCYIDLDHYLPTKHALEWTWNKMDKGSVVLCDDYNPSRVGGSASKAIYEFTEGKKADIDIINTSNWVNYNWHPKQIAWRRK